MTSSVIALSKPSNWNPISFPIVTVFWISKSILWSISCGSSTGYGVALEGIPELDLREWSILCLSLLQFSKKRVEDTSLIDLLFRVRDAARVGILEIDGGLLGMSEEKENPRGTLRSGMGLSSVGLSA